MKNNFNSSSIGTGTHTIRASSGKSTGKRRSRYKCKNYERVTRDCKILRISCVGFSNVLCPKHNDI